MREMFQIVLDIILLAVDCEKNFASSTLPCKEKKRGKIPFQLKKDSSHLLRKMVKASNNEYCYFVLL